MILEIHSYDAEFFLTLGIEKHSQIAFAAKRTSLEIMHMESLIRLKLIKILGFS